MGREVKRVPVDFDWPLNKVWEGFLTPEKFHSDPCPADCRGGYSWQYSRLYDLWYGKAPFDPAMSGSTPLTVDTPAVRAFAERNINHSPEFYGSGERAIVREAQRLIDMWNQQWCHHLSQADVDVLLEEGRLRDFTHSFDPKREGADRWQKIEPPVRPTPAQVEEWNIRSFGHDSSNAWLVIKARCERYGMPDVCSVCEGYGGVEAYPGQREECEAWEWEEPPTGEGYQLWETVSEGSPISPVFDTPEGLARWMTSPAYRWGIVKSDADRPSFEGAMKFIKAGWAPTFIATSDGVKDGATAIGEKQDMEDIIASPSSRLGGGGL